MLFQAVVIFLPILIFFKFHVKGERSIASRYLHNFFCVRGLSNTFMTKFEMFMSVDISGGGGGKPGKIF